MEFFKNFSQTRNKRIVSAILAATFIYGQSNAVSFGSIFSFFKKTTNQAVSGSVQQCPQIGDFANSGNLGIIPGITDSVKKSFFTPKATIFTIFGISVCLGILYYFRKDVSKLFSGKSSKSKKEERERREKEKEEKEKKENERRELEKKRNEEEKERKRLEEDKQKELEEKEFEKNLKEQRDRKREADNIDRKRLEEERKKKEKEKTERELREREAEKREAEKREAEKREAEKREAEKREAEKRESERKENERRELEKKNAENPVSQELSDKLFKGCNEGDIDLVRESLEKGVNPNQITCGSTPLGVACCWNCNPAIVFLLLSKGADINQLNDRNETALNIAIEKLRKVTCAQDKENEAPNLKSIIKILLNHQNLDPNQIVEAKFNNNVIHYVIEVEDLFENEKERLATIVKLLQHPNAKNAINQTGRNGQTPVYMACSMACKNKNLAVVEILLANGADANKIIEEKLSKDTTSPLYLACAQQDEKMFDLLVKQRHANINTPFKDGLTLLHKLCNEDKPKNLEFFIKNCKRYPELQFDINLVITEKNNSCRGLTPLHLACYAKRTQAVKLLLQEKDNANFNLDVDKEVVENGEFKNWTPLAFACNHGRVDNIKNTKSIIDDLLKHKANKEKLINGRTALDIAKEKIENKDHLAEVKNLFGENSADHVPGANNGEPQQLIIQDRD